MRHAYWQPVRMSSGQRDRQAGIYECSLAQKFTFWIFKVTENIRKEIYIKKRRDVWIEC